MTEEGARLANLQTKDCMSPHRRAIDGYRQIGIDLAFGFFPGWGNGDALPQFLQIEMLVR